MKIENARAVRGLIAVAQNIVKDYVTKTSGPNGFSWPEMGYQQTHGGSVNLCPVRSP